MREQIIFGLSVWIRQGYHKIAVRMVDREKFVFVAPHNRNYTFNVIPFGLKNSPSLHTAMMKDLKDKRDKLFILRITEMKTLKNDVIMLSAAGVVTIGGKWLIFSSKTIIDDILLWRDMNELALTYFCCI